MNIITLQDVKKVVSLMCDTIIEKEVEFCNLDSAAGDGDLGLSLAKGFKVVKKEIDNLSEKSIGSFLKDASALIAEHCGGASGPIWSTAFRGAAKSIGDSHEMNVNEASLMLENAVLAIQKKGGAKLGDKTLLDALIPAVECLKQNSKSGTKTAFEGAAQCALNGAEKTKDMVAARGRASYVGERSLSYPDAGATVVAILFKEIYNKLS